MIASITVNWLAVLAASVAQMVVGFLWYSPMLFGKTWMKLSGIKPNPKMDKSAMMKPMIWMFVGTLVGALVLSQFIAYAGAKGIVQGALIGIMAAIGFQVTSHSASVLFERKPFQLYLLNIGHMLVGMALSGAILGHFA